MGDAPVYWVTAGIALLILGLPVLTWAVTWVYYRGELADERSYSARLESRIAAQDKIIAAAEKAGFVVVDRGRHAARPDGGRDE